MTLIHKLRARVVARDAESTERYWALLRLGAVGDPKAETPANVEALESAAAAIGRSADDIEADLAILQELAGLRADGCEREFAAAMETRRMIEGRIVAADRAIDTAQDARRELDGEWATAQGVVAEINRRRERAQELQRLLRERGHVAPVPAPAAPKPAKGVRS